MKKSTLFILLPVLAFLFTACDKSEKTTLVVDFEDVNLGTTGYWDGSDLSGKAQTDTLYGTAVTDLYGSFKSNNFEFDNVYTKNWYSWIGFACSNKNDTTTVGFGNQYSVVTGAGANNSKNFGVAYSSAGMKCPANCSAVSVMLANSTYAYLYMKNGDSGYGVVSANKYTTDNWFKVTISGYLARKKTASVDYYLADFRNSKSFISKSWEKVDLSALGKVDSLNFSFDSNNYMTPTYVCLDNMTFEQESAE